MEITYEPQTPTPQPASNKEDIILDGRCIGEMSKMENCFVCSIRLLKDYHFYAYGSEGTKKKALSEALKHAKKSINEASNSLAWIEMRI